MARTTSAALRSAVFAQETGEAFVLLVTIEHASLAAPVRVCSAGEVILPIAGVRGVVSRGHEFIEYPFELTLPGQEEDALPAAKFKIDNVSQEITVAVRGMTSPATVTIEIVLASSPDTVEVSFSDFTLRNISYNQLTVEGTLTVEHFALEPYPEGRITPSSFPGSF